MRQACTVCLSFPTSYPTSHASACLCARTRRALASTGVKASMSGAELLVGTIVTLHSLQRDELNGKSGRVVSAIDAVSGRAGVQVDGIEKPLALKFSNLTVIVAEQRDSDRLTTQAIEQAALSVDSKTLARFVTTHSLRSSEKVKRLFAAEMSSGVALGGSWCCSSSTLWCPTCAVRRAAA